jgi:3-methylcrotonyl-CoA carboxylase alpha subunit
VIEKLLIANRGEIAVRIIQTCRKLDINSVAVFSEADRSALHVRMADEAVPLGPPPPLQSYLNIQAVIDAVKSSGSDAVHPGYGFLAENAGFARAVEQAGAVWVGPPPPVIALMGDKIAAKALAEREGVPIVPGYNGAGQDSETLAREAERIGYPVMLKAAAGGGGRGMRPVTERSALAASIESARREALSSFGDGRLFLEKLLVRPRHVEIQVLADSHGNAVFLGERDCSAQRRHQKVLEEAPSPAVCPALRARMGDSALRLARAGGYVNAGTVEFLLAGEDYYFLEMNTRIQVEHPVTEMVTGLDLIELQLRIASGEPLPLKQEDVKIRGHAMEARIYAEDPERSFRPSAGRLTQFQPADGPGIRNDVGVQTGSGVPHLYDPLLAKLIVHAETRQGTIEELQSALFSYRVAGVETNLRFLQWLAQQPALLSGEVDIEFLERAWVPEGERDLPWSVPVLAALASAPSAASSGEPDPWKTLRGWRLFGIERRSQYRWGSRAWRVLLQPLGDNRWKVSSGSEQHVVEVNVRDGQLQLVELKADGAVVNGTVHRDVAGVDVVFDGSHYRLQNFVPESEHSGAAHGGSSEGSLEAPMPGTVARVLVSEGEEVSASQPLVILEAMKMEHAIVSPRAGVVEAVLFEEGDMAPAGSPVVTLRAL